MIGAARTGAANRAFTLGVMDASEQVIGEFHDDWLAVTAKAKAVEFIHARTSAANDHIVCGPAKGELDHMGSGTPKGPAFSQVNFVTCRDQQCVNLLRRTLSRLSSAS